MNRTRLFWTLALALATAGMAATASAGPIITVDPTSVGPVACGDEATFTVHYDPNDYTGELWYFDITVANGAGNYVIFDDANNSSDVAVADWAGGQLLINGVGEYEVAVGGAVIGGDPVPAETAVDLFTITVHADATGLGELNILDVTLRDAGGDEISADPVTNPLATIDVDCDAPPVPVMNAEPPYTAGTENTVSWTAVADPSGPVEYNVRCSNGDQSGWITATSWTFGGLVHGATYDYDVQVRDIVGNESAFSDVVSSTQDTGAPESAAGPLDPAYGGPGFAGDIYVPWTASDDLSGVQSVELRYRVDGGPWDNFGTTFTVSPIEFTVATDGSDDGVYEFFTLAVDNAGNVEIDPELDSVETTVDTSAPDAPEMVLEPEFTQGECNEVCWEPVGGATEYQVFAENGTTVDSGWITDTCYEFCGLTDGTEYTYYVQAKDELGNMGDISTPTSSTQDATAPESEITAPTDGNMLNQTFPITVYYDDEDAGIVGSGVALIRLFYKQGTGPWTQYGTGFPPGPDISFTAPADGPYQFYTIAEDEVGNVEAAPATPDLALLIDTMGPQGTFVINDDDAYTTEAMVTLNSAITDANGVVEMQFRDAGDPWPVDWEPYAATFDWTLPAGDGTKTVEARYRDGTGQISGVFSDDIVLDMTAPAPVTTFRPEGGHEVVNITWTDPADTDIDVIEIWACLWDDVTDGLGESVYPEFDDVSYFDGAGESPSVADLTADPDWVLLATVDPGEEAYVHSETSPWARAAYGYHAFARDLAGNYSVSAPNWSRRVVNYIRGDFDGNGVIDIIPDVSMFAAAYGTEEGDDAYNNIMDIGDSGNTVPITDNDIDFEDLMVLALNYNAQGKAATGEPETPVLAWYQVDETTWAMGLAEPCNSLKAVRLAAKLPDGVTADLADGRDLDAGLAHLLVNDERHGLDVAFAVLGNNSVLPGSGEIFRITTSQPVDMTGIDVEVRDASNESIEFEMTSEPLVALPSVYAVEGNFPNPFNPQTTIKFALPEAQDVRIEIYDVRGYRVRLLVDESMPAGTHSVVWNGRDGYGRQAASGTYFYRVQAGPLNETRRMLLVK